MLASVIESFSGGVVALLSGLEGSISSRDIRWTYFRFMGHFFMLSVVGYMAVSATMAVLIIAASLVFLGPVLGPLAVGILSWLSIVVLVILWLIGKFPAQLFVGSFGVLRPFFTATQLSFLLASVLIPMGCDGFMLEGIDVICGRSKCDGLSNIRSEYKSPSFARTLWLFCCNLALRVGLQATIWLVTPGRARLAVDPILSAFLLGSQLVSVYTVRIRRRSFTHHMNWCAANFLRILGFSLPLHFIQESHGIIGSFLGLGLAYSVSAALVEPIILNDMKQA